MLHGSRFLVIQTAFLGDVILTLPVIQILRKNNPGAVIDFLVIPRSAELLHGHPDITEVITFDKKGKDSGITGVVRCAGILRRKGYDTAVIPHRSLRSASLAIIAGIPRRIGFNTSSGKLLLTDVVSYSSNSHEVERNLSLLGTIGIMQKGKEFPRLYPSEDDFALVNTMLNNKNISSSTPLIALAPGTVWNTKRWPPERFVDLAKQLIKNGFTVLFIGGKADEEICSRIERECQSRMVLNMAGRLSLLQSAAMIHRSKVLVSNDSAPMHIAVAMGTPVVAIFGATVPAFGFAPFGAYDRVAETLGLECRPCSIHGGDRCPITTFDCMNNISAATVYKHVSEILQQSASG